MGVPKIHTPQEFIHVLRDEVNNALPEGHRAFVVTIESIPYLLSFIGSVYQTVLKHRYQLMDAEFLVRSEVGELLFNSGKYPKITYSLSAPSVQSYEDTAIRKLVHVLTYPIGRKVRGKRYIRFLNSLSPLQRLAITVLELDGYFAVTPDFEFYMNQVLQAPHLLKERELRVIQELYGLDTPELKSWGVSETYRMLTQLSPKFGITPEAVRQVYVKSIAKLRVMQSIVRSQVLDFSPESIV